MIKVIKYILISGLFIGFSFWWNISINDISLRFCSDKSNELQKRVSVYTEAWKKTEECILIINKSNNTGYINLHFTSQTSTNQWEKACSLPGNPDDIFVKYLKPSWSGLVYIDANTERRESFEISFPIWIWWTKWWCLAFFATEENKDMKTEWSSLSLINRKANLFDIRVDDKEEILSKINFLSTEKSSSNVLVIWNKLKSWIERNNVDKTISINIWADNLGNVDQIIVFSGNAHSLFGFKKNISQTGFVVRREKSEHINITQNSLSIPEYQWLFWIKLNLNQSPYFDFDTSHIPHEKLIWKNENFSVVFFVFSWISVLFWLMIFFSIFMIYIILRKFLSIKK